LVKPISTVFVPESKRRALISTPENGEKAESEDEMTNLLGGF
jgi:hypothetical protein